MAESNRSATERQSSLSATAHEKTGTKPVLAERNSAVQQKKVLLRLENAKMHFPVKKENIFQRETLAVKAVDGVTIDIYQGETFGLVGESGCGKSTLGRLILELYKPTAGKVYYFGVTLDDYAPAYVRRLINKLPSIRERDPARLFEQYRDTIALVGGLLLADDRAAVKNALLERFEAVSRLRKALEKLELHKFMPAPPDSSEGNRSEKHLHRQKALEDAVALERANVCAKNEVLETQRAKTAAKYSASGDDQNPFALLESWRSVGINMTLLTNEETRQLRRYLQIVFQDPYSSLNPRLTVGNLISEALVAHGVFPKGSETLEKYTLKIMDDCGLQKYMLHRYPHQFSGGQRQRIGIARALSLKPAFMVCDEAVSALDVSIQSQIINLLIDLKEKNQLTYLFISHDLSTVKFISDRVGVMYLGNIIELGESHDIYKDPLHPYTEALLEAIPTTEESAGKELQVLEGDIPSPINPPLGCKFHTRCRYATDLCKAEYPAWREYKPGHFVACHFPVNKADRG